MPAPLLSIAGVLTEMKERFLANRPLIVQATLLFALLSVLIAVAGSGGSFGQAVSLGLSVLASVAYTGMVIQLLCVPGSDGDLPGLWKGILPVLARLIWVTLLTGIMIATGLLLFVVPGLILITIWSVAIETVVVERATVLGSLRRSRELVRGNGWRVFLFLLVLALILLMAATLALLVAAPFGTGLLGVAVSAFTVAALVNPVLVIGPAALYNCLTGGSLADRGLSDSPDPVEELPGRQKESRSQPDRQPPQE